MIFKLIVTVSAASIAISAIKISFIPAPLPIPRTRQVNVRNELYFGMSKPGGEISEAEWQEFLNKNITPKFREGLTVVEGKGQYLNQEGKLIKENTKLLILIHQNNSNTKSKIRALIEEYKRQFNQESVLQVTTNLD
ncbi:hypothetical protein NIES4101_53530 [Calothrix sp. NIES-4101]|nr:hypothetical protein NIES4101_53530 [Calothrix sp. NIES-4101]